MKPTKFNVGDRVRCVDPDCDCGGDQGTIVFVSEEDVEEPYNVAWDDDEQIDYLTKLGFTDVGYATPEDCLERVEEVTA